MHLIIHGSKMELLFKLVLAAVIFLSHELLRSPFRNEHFVNVSPSRRSIFSQWKCSMKENWTTNLSLTSQLPSGIVGRPGTLKWLACRFCAVLLDTIQTSFLLSGLLHSLEQYSVMHLATSCFQWSSSLSLICEGDKQETSERRRTDIVFKYAVIDKPSVFFPPHTICACCHHHATQ